MKTTIVILILTLLMLAGGVQAAKCKFEIEEAGQFESRRLILFRGATVGLAGHFGIKNDQHYLKGLFASNFKARATFTADTPLELTLADDRALKLNVVTEVISSKLKFGHIITASREAQPMFSLTPEQWSALQESPIVSLHMRFDAKGERQSETRKVKGKHAQRIIDALNCITQESHTISPVEPVPEAIN